MLEDWTESSLGDVFEIVTGNTPSKKSKENYGGQVPFLKPPDIQNQRLGKASTFLTQKGKELARIIPVNSVLVTCIGNLGRAGITIEEVAFNQQINAILPRPEIDPKFVFYQVQSLSFKNALEKKSTSTTVALVNKSNFKTIRFKFPLLPEQRVIVAKIEELFSELDNGIVNLKTAQEQLRVYRQAVLKDAFEGKLTAQWRSGQDQLPNADKLLKQINLRRESKFKERLGEWHELVADWKSTGSKGKKPSKPRNQFKNIDNFEANIPEFNIPDKWNWTTLGYFTSKLSDGPFGSNLKGKDYISNGIRVIRLENIKNLDFDDSKKSFISEEKYKTLAHYSVYPGDVIFSTFIAETTKVVILPSKFDFAINKADCVCIRPESGVSNKYLQYYLSSRISWSLLINEVHGATRPRVNTTQLKAMGIPACSSEEQLQIVQEIESRLSVCDKLEETIQESLEKAEALRQSILKKAFEGLLLTQQEMEAYKKEPDWETTEQVLQRTKGEKVKTEAPKIAAKTKSKTVGKFISTTDMHAGVIAKVIQLHENNTKFLDKLSHVKCEKIAHLAEYYVGLDLGRVPRKDAAGPDDYPHLKKVESRAQKAGFFTKIPQGIGYSYKTNRQANAIIRKTDTFLSEEQTKKLDYLLQTFLKFDLEQAEVVATTYAGWNNLLLDGLKPTDEQIVFESRENWSKRKLIIPREQFFKVIQWMKDKDLVPSGTGLKVDKPIVNKRTGKR